MYVRLKHSKKAKYPTMQIVEGVRDGDKVRQRTIAHLGVVKGEKDLRKLKKLAENLIERQTEHGFDEVDLHHVYRTMDAIEGLEGEIQKQAFSTVTKYSEKPVDCFFFDVTTLYFESVIQDSLRDFGFSKDQKYHSVQIVFALVVDSQGMPLAYETFKGNLAETKTLIPVLEKLRERFSVANVTVVCDRGLASKTNVEALQTNQFHFVIASKLRSMSKKLKLRTCLKSMIRMLCCYKSADRRF